MQLIARFISDKYDDIFRLAEKEGTLADFEKIPKAAEYNGLVIDLEDEDDESFVEQTVRVNAETIEKLFSIKVESEDQMYEESQKSWTDGLQRAGLDPNEELRKVNELMAKDS